MKHRGQTLVIFALFLTVLIGVSALAIDYANWLLTDRRLQNVTDHASLAGASVFNQNVVNTTCGSNPALCTDALAQSWTSLDQELSLGLDTAQIFCLASANTQSAGWTNASDAGCAAKAFGHRIWVSTPPPSNAAYTQTPNGTGGGLSGAFGVVWVRVDRPTTTFLAGIFGIVARDRVGWSTAGVLPNDFALEIFCRDGNPLQSNCAAGQGASGSLSIDGGGGITIDRGDIGSSNSLWVSSVVGPGVVVDSGNVFLVSGTCDNPASGGKWNCPPATVGGITDGLGNPKNAFHIPPLVPEQFILPTGIDNTDCAAGPCVPGTGANGQTPMTWSCSGSSCGFATVDTVNGTVECSGLQGSGRQNLAPVSDGQVANFKGNLSGSTNNNIFRNIWGSLDPTGTTLPLPPSAATPFPATPTPADNVFSMDGSNATYIAAVDTPNGSIEVGTQIYARFVMFKTKGNNGTYDPAVNSGYNVTMTAQLVEKRNGVWTNLGTPTADLPANDVITAYQIPTVSYTALQSLNNPTLGIKFVVTSPSGTGNNDPLRRGAGISWAEVYLDTQPVPPPPPMIPPGLYESITVDGGCAILDPTGLYSSPSGLSQNQMPGVYNFKGSNGKIELTGNSSQCSPAANCSSYLIGDGVSLVFDANWPDPNNNGLVLGADAALVINTGQSSNQDCTVWHATNMSFPLCPLPSDALAAAWMVDPGDADGTGVSPWGGPCAAASPCDISRSSYTPTADYRGISFYFRTAAWPPSGTAARFQISGTSSHPSGVSFRGILFAPWDNVKITGGNGFNTVGQVIAWTAKFAGQATIHLDYPYTRCVVNNSCLPYLLEPTVGS